MATLHLTILLAFELLLPPDERTKVQFCRLLRNSYEGSRFAWILKFDFLIKAKDEGLLRFVNELAKMRAGY